MALARDNPEEYEATMLGISSLRRLSQIRQDIDALRESLSTLKDLIDYLETDFNILYDHLLNWKTSAEEANNPERSGSAVR